MMIISLVTVQRLHLETYHNFNKICGLILTLTFIFAGCNENFGPSACQVKAANCQFARKSSPDAGCSNPYTGRRTKFCLYFLSLNPADLTRVKFACQAMHANTAMANGMAGASKAMGAMNKVLQTQLSEMPIFD